MYLTNLKAINPVLRILLIIAMTLAAHIAVKLIRRFSQWMLTSKGKGRVVSEQNLSQRHPKIATIITILVSTATFSLYFVSVGMILHEFKISLTTYFASATVIGLAVGFGLQGFVQDVVIGLTLIFSDALSIGDVVKLGDEIGKIGNIGLRFTSIVNLQGQDILIPNRNISVISRFRGGCIRAYVDIQLPEGSDEKELSSEIKEIADNMFHQHKSIILESPEIFGIMEAPNRRWRYMRIKFKIWPGQMKIVEETFKERIVYCLKKSSQDYASWMITVTYKVE